VARLPLRLATPALIAMAFAGPPARAGDGPPAHNDGSSYAAMLGYLDGSRIDGHAFGGTSGATAVNLSAGDLNQQANLRAFAVGGNAQAGIVSDQMHHADRADAPLHATASIGGAAFADGRGIASVNQASGSGNTELNAVAASLAQQGIRETTDGSLSAAVSASARGQASARPHGPGNGTRSVAVEATAMKGFDGVLQLNQVAGSGNAAGNQLLLAAPANPR
jgi:hypothetical protein